MTITSPASYFLYVYIRVSIKFWHFIESYITKLLNILNLA